MGSTPLEYCWFIYKIGGRTGRLTGQFETYAQMFCLARISHYHASNGTEGLAAIQSAGRPIVANRSAARNSMTWPRTEES